MCGVEVNLPCNSTALTLHIANHKVAVTTRAVKAGRLEAKPYLRRDDKDKVCDVWVRSTATLVFKSEDYVFRKGEALRVHGERSIVAEEDVEPSRPSVPRFGIMIYSSVVLAAGPFAVYDSQHMLHTGSDCFTLAWYRGSNRAWMHVGRLAPRRL